MGVADNGLNLTTRVLTYPDEIAASEAEQRARRAAAGKTERLANDKTTGEYVSAGVGALKGFVQGVHNGSGFVDSVRQGVDGALGITGQPGDSSIPT
jgi:hypothetical protein